jgi:hypothetical protein
MWRLREGGTQVQFTVCHIDKWPLKRVCLVILSYIVRTSIVAKQSRFNGWKDPNTLSGHVKSLFFQLLSSMAHFDLPWTGFTLVNNTIRVCYITLIHLIGNIDWFDRLLYCDLYYYSACYLHIIINTHLLTYLLGFN